MAWMYIQERSAKDASPLQEIQDESETLLPTVQLGTTARFHVRDFLSFLNKGANFYNGEASAAPVAGNIGTLAWSNASYGQGATLSGVFASHPGTMALSSMVNGTFTVFLRERYVNGMNGN
jgi:hypothetical protein